ncbi:MAG: hypothetical protein ACU0DI_04140 [Paracoccaceae bacterium]
MAGLIILNTCGATSNTGVAVTAPAMSRDQSAAQVNYRTLYSDKPHMMFWPLRLGAQAAPSADAVSGGANQTGSVGGVTGPAHR